MLVCPECNKTSFVESSATVFNHWYKCLNCSKIISVRVQDPRGSRISYGLIEDELIECSGEINVEDNYNVPTSCTSGNRD